MISRQDKCQSISRKIMMPIVGCILGIALLIIVAVFGVGNATLMAYFHTSIQNDGQAITQEVEAFKKRAVAAADWLGKSPQLAQAIAGESRGMAMDLALSVMHSYQLDLMVITDRTGQVLVRAHDPQKYGDKLTGQLTIVNALQGRKSAGIELDQQVGMAVCAGVPLQNARGEIVGAVSLGYRLSSNQWVDLLKRTFGMEATVFGHDQRLVTTIKNENGERISGTKLNNPRIERKVLGEGAPYIGETVIKNEKYLATYLPLRDIRQNIVGMLFCGQKIGVIQRLTAGIGFWITIIVLGLSALMLQMLAVVIRKSVTQPLHETVAVIQEIAAGNLRKRVILKSVQELVTLSEAFNRLIDKLAGTMGTINQDTEILNQSSEALEHVAKLMVANSQTTSTKTATVSAAVEQISAGMSQTAGALSETGGSIDRISNNIEGISGSIRNLASASKQSSEGVTQSTQLVSEITASIGEASESAQEVRKEVNSVVRSVKAMNQSLTAISKNCDHSTQITAEAEVKVRETNEIIAQLVESSKQISKIISIINDIADQTNMLALNAAIEAAGAGEAGKGFAVVANEVKELAKQTAEATDEISQQIEAILQNTSGAVTAVEGITGVIGEIAEITNQITVAVTEQTTTVEEVSEAVVRAAQRVGSITRKVGEISGNALNVSRHMEESATGVHQIAKSTGELSVAVKDVAANTERASVNVNELSRTSQEISKGVIEISRSIQEIKGNAGEMAVGAITEKASAASLAEVAERLDGLVKQFTI